MSTQAVRHFIRGLLQLNPQIPPLHVAVPLGGAEHTLPQEPQWVGSFCGLTHEPLQLTSGG